MNELKIQGQSGCSLQIIESENGDLKVKKWCKPEYISRLKSQYNKQLLYSDVVIDGVKTPRPEFDDIYGIMTMPYISGDSFIEYLQKATVDDIREFEKTLIGIIETEYAASELTEINKDVFVNKVNSVIENIAKKHPEDTWVANPVITKLNTIDYIKIPQGTCHGDLTLSNMIFTDSSVYLIDFLDSFIETPLQDIAKIRQDTFFGWSLLMVNGSYNKTHVLTAMKHIDEAVDKYFSKFDWYKEYYHMLQYINLIRILPYANEERYCKVIKMLDRIKDLL